MSESQIDKSRFCRKLCKIILHRYLVESIRADFALNYAKKDYIAANRWRCSSYAYKQIWIPYICEKSQRGSLFKVKRSIIKHLYFARHLPKMFLFSPDRFFLAPTIPKLFSFLKSVHQNRFYKPFCVFGSRGQRSFPLKRSIFKIAQMLRNWYQMKALLIRNNAM